MKIAGDDGDSIGRQVQEEPFADDQNLVGRPIHPGEERAVPRDLADPGRPIRVGRSRAHPYRRPRDDPLGACPGSGHSPDHIFAPFLGNLPGVGIVGDRVGELGFQRAVVSCPARGVGHRGKRDHTIPFPSRSVFAGMRRPFEFPSPMPLQSAGRARVSSHHG